MRAEHESAHRGQAGRGEAAPARSGLAFPRAPARPLLVEQVEIELLRLEREEVAAACADAARLALAMHAQGRASDAGAPGVGESTRSCDHATPWRPIDESLPRRVHAWRERVRGLLAALQLEGLAVPSVLAQAFGGELAAWPSAASLAQAACTWSPSDEHRVLCARALRVAGLPDEAREWLCSVPPEARPRDLACELGLEHPADADLSGAGERVVEPGVGGLA